MFLQKLSKFPAVSCKFFIIDLFLRLLYLEMSGIDIKFVDYVPGSSSTLTVVISFDPSPMRETLSSDAPEDIDLARGGILLETADLARTINGKRSEVRTLNTSKCWRIWEFDTGEDGGGGRRVKVVGSARDICLSGRGPSDYFNYQTYLVGLEHCRPIREDRTPRATRFFMNNDER